MGLRQSLRRIAAKNGEFIVVVEKFETRFVDAGWVHPYIGGACFYVTIRDVLHGISWISIEI